MGLMEFLILCLIAVGIAWVAVYALGALFPGHPAIVDKIIWGIALLIIIVALLQATGIMKYDPKIPHV